MLSTYAVNNLVVHAISLVTRLLMYLILLDTLEVFFIALDMAKTFNHIIPLVNNGGKVKE